MMSLVTSTPLTPPAQCAQCYITFSEQNLDFKKIERQKNGSMNDFIGIYIL